MTTPLTTFSHWDSPRHLQASPLQQNHLSLTRFGSEHRFTLRHYAVHFVLGGALRYQFDGQRFHVAEGQFVLINAGQEVLLTPEDTSEVLCLHLSEATLVQAMDDCQEHEADWCDLCDCLRPDGHIMLCEQVYSQEQDTFGPYLKQLASALIEDETNIGEDISIIGAEASHQLLEAQAETYRRLLNLTSAKLSTKRELYRRLCLAQDHIHHHLHDTLDLDTLSQVACLSKYHFIRLFKEAFGQTPRQYLIARRLERASSLLIHSRKTFHEICQEVGLKDSSSFGRLFKRSFGATPHLYRQMHAQG